MAENKTEEQINPAYDDTQSIVDALLGRRIVKLEKPPVSAYSMGEAQILLDDGTVLLLEGHDGGCSCSAGCYSLEYLASLGDVDNIITDVEFYNDPASDYTGGDGNYSIFVFADNKKINLATFEGSDGNGYYGTGYYVTVRKPRY